MPLMQPTKEFLSFLQKNPNIRDRIRAAPGKTLLYAGKIIRPAWKEISDLKRSDPGFKDKETLPDVLARTPITGGPFPNLLTYTQDTENKVPWQDNGFIIWRALPGIFAANAVGQVSFYIGSDIKYANADPGSEERKVFVVTELPVLLRNTKIDPATRDILEYYRRCVAGGKSNIDFGYRAG